MVTSGYGYQFTPVLTSKPWCRALPCTPTGVLNCPELPWTALNCPELPICSQDCSLPPSEEALRFLSRRVTPLRSPGAVAASHAPGSFHPLKATSGFSIKKRSRWIDQRINGLKLNRSQIDPSNNQPIIQSELIKYLRPSPQNCPPGPSSSSLLWRRPGRRLTRRSHGVTLPNHPWTLWSSLGRSSSFSESIYGSYGSIHGVSLFMGYCPPGFQWVSWSIPIYGSHGMLLVSLIPTDDQWLLHGLNLCAEVRQSCT